MKRELERVEEGGGRSTSKGDEDVGVEQDVLDILLERSGVKGIMWDPAKEGTGREGGGEPVEGRGRVDEGMVFAEAELEDCWM